VKTTMTERACIVLDVGKTLSKLTLWSPRGLLLDRRVRPNERVETDTGDRGLDAGGVESWLAHALSDFARIAAVGAIIPVAHGAAAALLDEGGLLRAPLDYEQAIPGAVRQAYDAQREPFALTGSPALPHGLNLGAQLHYLESQRGGPMGPSVSIVPWAQYWSWLLSGVASADLTNLGCHTDLWYPLSGTYSKLSIERGWAARMAPLAPSGAALGALRQRWVERTGLATDVRVHCGLHDSNAALVAARAHPEIAAHDATVLSTGTWFVAMRAPSAPTDIASLSETRDCLVNVDAFGQPVPSARFMGGREVEILAAGQRVDASEDQPALLRSVVSVLARGTMALPTFTPGSGPYPGGHGRWIGTLGNDTERLVAVCLYAALVADESLELIGARDRLLVEGRFARCEVFTRALASLRPKTAVYVAHSEGDASFGALRLLRPDIPPPSSLTRVEPLPEDLGEYRRRWRQEAARVA
jgi:sugar (pentulose or hexulose) kinase